VQVRPLLRWTSFLVRVTLRALGFEDLLLLVQVIQQQQQQPQTT